MVLVSVFSTTLSLPLTNSPFSRRHVFEFLAEIALPTSVTGIGLFFSVFMIGLTALQARYTAFSPRNSEEFTSASRSVKPGLIASGIVSAWTWAATLVGPNLFRFHQRTDVGVISCKAARLHINLVRSRFDLDILD
jgi:hypothetical protein